MWILTWHVGKETGTMSFHEWYNADRMAQTFRPGVMAIIRRVER